MFTIEKTFSKANISKTIRFTEQLNSRLVVLASEEDISFNELVLRCCQYALDHYGGKQEPGRQEEHMDD